MYSIHYSPNVTEILGQYRKPSRKHSVRNMLKFIVNSIAHKIQLIDSKCGQSEFQKVHKK